LEILTRHYDRSDVKKRRSEVTARTYGKPEEGGKAIDLNALPVEKTTDSQSPKRSRVSVRRNSQTKPGKPKFDAVVEEAAMQESQS
jgi:hypothetical protein